MPLKFMMIGAVLSIIISLCFLLGSNTTLLSNASSNPPLQIQTDLKHSDAPFGTESKSYIVRLQRAVQFLQGFEQANEIQTIFQQWLIESRNDAIQYAAVFMQQYPQQSIALAVLEAADENEQVQIMNTLINESGLGIYTFDFAFRAWGESSPIHALNWVTDTIPMATQASANQFVFEGWIKSAPVDSIDYLSTFGPMDIKLPDLSAIFSIWASESSESAFQYLLHSQLQNNTELVSISLRHIAEQHPEQLRASLDLLTITPEQRISSLVPAIRVLFQHHPSDGLRLMHDLESPHYSIIYAGASAFAQHHLDNAKHWLRQTENPEHKAAIAAGIAETWVNQDMQGAVHWLLSQTNDIQQLVAADYTAAMSAHDPAFTAEHLYEQLPIEQSLELLRQSDTASAWAKQDPEGALNWIETLPPSSEKLALINQASTQAAQQDLAQLESWIDTLENEDEYQSAVFSTAYALASEQEYANAANWLYHKLPNNRNDERMNGILEVWLAHNTAQAKAWITAHDYLSEEERKQLVAKALNH
ncbi:hypothetical protein [Echinimonas agarilytica]|uniref:Uncharacterized protein n=1 Tax=Echinimonas agarilytica TaxID=1215918 RepID=A0AA41W621_9GAMM|nr:hypothetical protein [Echinimonas agarilytica]MCM2679605.1 hypothetical protein [Echinimonas agarilytica]